MKSNNTMRRACFLGFSIFLFLMTACNDTEDSAPDMPILQEQSQMRKMRATIFNTDVLNYGWQNYRTYLPDSKTGKILWLDACRRDGNEHPDTNLLGFTTSDFYIDNESITEYCIPDYIPEKGYYNYAISYNADSTRIAIATSYPEYGMQCQFDSIKGDTLYVTQYEMHEKDIPTLIAVEVYVRMTEETLKIRRETYTYDLSQYLKDAQK